MLYVARGSEGFIGGGGRKSIIGYIIYNKKKENKPQGVPDYLYDRAATKGEVERIKRSAERDGRVTTPEEMIEMWKEQNKWRGGIGGPDFLRFIADGVIRADVKRNSKGEFERIEIRDHEGNVVFYSTEKEFGDAWLRSVRGSHYSDESGFPIN